MQKDFWKNRKKPNAFFNPETETDPDQKPTFEQKTDSDPDRSQKVNPAGLYPIYPPLNPTMLRAKAN
jgi:hypothetical protein